jgi:hypothetical protein
LSEWRPIETARKDETEVLLWDGGVYVGHWLDGTWVWVMAPRDAIDRQLHLDWCHPTHWMPLPDPPVSPVQK